MKDFTQYQEALELRELGFDEPCFVYYKDGRITGVNKWDREDWGFHVITIKEVTSVTSEIVIAPSYSQAFRWFREKYSLESFIVPSVNEQDKIIYRFAFGNLSKSVKYDFEDKMDYQFEDYNTYEEAELELLKHLIKIVKEKQNGRSS